MAAKAGRSDVVALLLSANASADSQLPDGGSPLLAASYKGHRAVVSRLLQAGALVNACRPDGLTALSAGHDGNIKVYGGEKLIERLPCCRAC